MSDWLLGALLILGVVLVYLPVLHAGFVWDDDPYLLHNPNLIGLHGLAQIWTTSAADVSPLTSTTFWFEHLLWGLSPAPYHLVNVLTHAACAIALWQVLRGLAIPGAWFGAALWAVHPVEVESVAWVSELKNPESGLAFLLAIAFFVKWLRSAERTHYGIAVVCAAIALASKSSTVVLPAVLCLSAWWLEGHWRWRNLIITAPFLALSAITAGCTMWVVHGQVALVRDMRWQQTWPERYVTAGDAVWFYLAKLIWPYPQASIYPGWNLDADSLQAYLPILAVLATLVVLWSLSHTSLRGCFFAFAYFVVALLPVLGFVPHFILQYSKAFDHFQYLASMGPLTLAGAGLSRLFARLLPARPVWAAAGCAGLLLVLGGISWQRTWVYESSMTFWTDAIAKNPDCWPGHYFLGTDLLDEHQPAQAEFHFRRAIEIDPNDATCHKMLGDTLLDLGKIKEAQAEFRRALELKPDYPEAQANLGGALLLTGNTDEAIDQLRAILKGRPDYLQALANLAGALAGKGDFDGAIVAYRHALKISPASAGLHRALGFALLKQGRVDEAVGEYRETVELAPDDADAHYHLGNLYLNSKQAAAAIDQYRAVLAVRPGDAKAHNNLGIALARTGHPDLAVDEFAQAVQWDPGFAEAQRNLAMAKAAAVKQKAAPAK